MYSLSLKNCLIIYFTFTTETPLSLVGGVVFGLLFGWLIGFCGACLFLFQKHSQDQYLNGFRASEQNSRKMIEGKYLVKTKAQTSLALYLRKRCNFVLTAVSILENKFLTVIF